MDERKIKNISQEMRQLVVDAVYHAQSGHPGGSLSICDILAVLFFEEMNLSPEQAEAPDRDYFVLSKGHAAPAYYAALALKGFFPKEEMANLRKIDSFLQGHPARGKVPGVDMSTGSLGQGLSAANGMAMAAKADGRPCRVYCVCGDGELQEGQIWEAAMTAAHYQLDHLTLFVDCNGLQLDGRVENIMNAAPIPAKFAAFGWNVLEIDGNDVASVYAAVELAKRVEKKPTAIICKTVKGKGVSFMENQVGWHGSAPNDEQYAAAMRELRE